VTFLCGGAWSGAPWRPTSTIYIVGLWDWWVVSYIGIRRVMCYTIGDAFLTRRGRASPLASARKPQCRIGHCAALSGQGHHGGMMYGSGVGKMGGKGAGRDDSYSTQIRTSNDERRWRSPMSYGGRRGAPLPTFTQIRINKHTMEQVCII